MSSELKRDSELCVLIPALNEESTIGDVVSRSLLWSRKVVVIDDGSTDDTAARAKESGAQVIRHPRNQGKGYCLKEGFERIFSEGWGAVIVIDGDGQHEPESIPEFIRTRQETRSGIVVGNRMTDLAAMPLVRRFTNQVMSSLLSWLIGQKVPDSQCGFRLITREAYSHLSLETNNYDTESEMLIQAARAGIHIASTPIKTIYLDEESKIHPIRDTIRFICLIIRHISRPRKI